MKRAFPFLLVSLILLSAVMIKPVQAYSLQITNKGNSHDYPLVAQLDQPYSITVRWVQDFQSIWGMIIFKAMEGTVVVDLPPMASGSYSYTITASFVIARSFTAYVIVLGKWGEGEYDATSDRHSWDLTVTPAQPTLIITNKGSSADYPTSIDASNPSITVTIRWFQDFTSQETRYDIYVVEIGGNVAAGVWENLPPGQYSHTYRDVGLGAQRSSWTLIAKVYAITSSGQTVGDDYTWTVIVAPTSKPPSLTLFSPEIHDLTVTVNGVTMPGTSDTTITRIHWDWGDGLSEDCSFPASHTYANAGTYTVTVTSYQSDGLSTSKSVTVTVQQFKQIPTAYIDSVSPNPADQRQMVSFSGHGSDPDGYITEYNWRSSIDGHLSGSQSFSTSSLSVGTHTIYFKVKDDDGLWSEEATAILEIKPQPTAGDLEVRVFDLQSRQPLERASVYVDGSYKGDTDFSGTLMVYSLSQGYHTAEARKSGYKAKSESVYIQTGSTQIVEIYLEREVRPKASTALTVELEPPSITAGVTSTVVIRGRLVRTDSGAGVQGKEVTISYSRGIIGTATTDSGGYYSYSWAGIALIEGSYMITASFGGDSSYEVSSDSATLYVTSAPPEVEVSIERTENILAGDALKVFFRQVIDWIPGTELPLIHDRVFFKVKGTANVAKLIVRLKSSTYGIVFPAEVEATKISSDTFMADIGVTRTYSNQEQKRAVVYLVFELAGSSILEVLSGPVREIVKRILDLVGEEAPKGEPLVDVNVFISEVVPVRVDGTELKPTSFSYRLETVAQGIAKEAPNRLIEIIIDYIVNLVGSESNILITTSSGARVGSLFENGIFRDVNEVPGAYYSGSGTHPQLIILPYSEGVYTTQVYATKAGEVNLYVWVKDAQKLTLSMSEGEVQEHKVEISTDKVYVDAPWWIPVWDQYQFWFIGCLIGTIVFTTSLLKRSTVKRIITARRRRKTKKPKILDVTSVPRIIEVTSAPKILEIKEEE